MTQLIEPTMRPLTTDDYIIAAKIVASCPKDRLAIVTGYLRMEVLRSTTQEI